MIRLRTKHQYFLLFIPAIIIFSFVVFGSPGYGEEGLLVKLELDPVADSQQINSIINDIYYPAKPPRANWVVNKLQTGIPVKLAFIVNGAVSTKNNTTKTVCFLVASRQGDRFTQIPVPLINDQLPTVSQIHKIVHNSAPDLTFSLASRPDEKPRKAVFNGSAYRFLGQPDDKATTSPVLAFRNYLALLDSSDAQHLFAAKMHFREFCSSSPSQEDLDKIFEYLTEFVSISKKEILALRDVSNWYSSWELISQEGGGIRHLFDKVFSSKFADLAQAGFTLNCSEYDATCFFEHDIYSYYTGCENGPSLKLISAEFGLEKESRHQIDWDEGGYEFDKITRDLIFWANTMEQNPNHVRFQEFESHMKENACLVYLIENDSINLSNPALSIYSKDQRKAIQLVAAIASESRWLNDFSKEILSELEKVNWVWNNQVSEKIDHFCPN
jgi:hypothetical protein